MRHLLPSRLKSCPDTSSRRFCNRLQTRRAGPGRAKTSRRARTRERGEEHPGPAASTNLAQGLPSWVFAKVPGGSDCIRQPRLVPLSPSHGLLLVPAHSGYKSLAPPLTSPLQATRWVSLAPPTGYMLGG